MWEEVGSGCLVWIPALALTRCMTCFIFLSLFPY